MSDDKDKILEMVRALRPPASEPAVSLGEELAKWAPDVVDRELKASAREQAWRRDLEGAAGTLIERLRAGTQPTPATHWQVPWVQTPRTACEPQRVGEPLEPSAAKVTCLDCVMFMLLAAMKPRRAP